MTSTTAGWVLFLTALSGMLALVGADISTLKSFHDATPMFWGSMIGHIATMIGAFAGGRMIPTGTKVGT